METPTEFGLGKSKIGQEAIQGFRQFPRVIGTAIGQLVPGLVPHSFIRVEFGSIRRKRFEMDSFIAAQEVSHGFSFVTAAVIPDDNDKTSQMFEQMTQKCSYLNVVEIGIHQTAEIKADAVSLGADRKCRDNRNLLPFLVVTMDWRPAFECPSAADRGDQEESGLVEEDEVSTQDLGVFFIRGHSFCFQRLICSSSRSRARRSGFWQLKFIPCSIRPTWSRLYLTPNVFTMTSAIRAVVHRSVRYPQAIAPRSNSRVSSFFWRASKRVGRPGEACTSYTLFPSRARWSRQRMTELAKQPKRRATALRLNPSSTSLSAWRRRSDKTWAEPLVRILMSSLDTSILHYLCRCQ